MYITYIYIGMHKCNETLRVNLLLFYDNEKLHQTMTICISESLLNETHQDWKCWLTPLLMRCPSKFLAPTIQKKESSLNIFLQTCDRKYDAGARLESSRRYQQWGIIIPNYLVIFLTNNLIDNWPNNYECRNIFIHMYLGGGGYLTGTRRSTSRFPSMQFLTMAGQLRVIMRGSLGKTKGR